MDQIGIVKRAAQLVWQFRGLWVIGAILALVGGGAGNFSSFNFGGGGGSGRGGTSPFPGVPNMPRIDGEAVLALVFALCCLVLILAVVFSVVRYVLTAGLYHAVDELDAGGTRPTLAQAWRAGWHRRTWRLFWQDLIVGIPLAVFAVALVFLAIVPWFAVASRNGAVQASGIILGILAILALILIFVAIGLVISLLSQFWYREAILADRGVIASIESAFRLVRSQLRDLGVMWLVMLGVGIAYAIVAVPVFLVVVLLAAAIGGLPGYAVYAATQSVVLGLLVGAPLFLVVVIIPTLIIGGYYTAFQSTAWTLAYRQATGRTAPAVPQPAPQPPAIDAATA